MKQQAYDFKVDVWAVGCCLYHLACFEPPFTGDNLIALGNNIVNKKPKSLPEQYSERFSTFLGRMLKKKAFDRPPIRDMLLFIPKSVKQSYRERYSSEQKSLERSDTADPKQPSVVENLQVALKGRLSNAPCPPGPQVPSKCSSQEAIELVSVSPIPLSSP